MNPEKINRLKVVRKLTARDLSTGKTLDLKKMTEVEKESLKLKRAGVREHINLRKKGLRARIYVNKAGEKYAVTTTKINDSISNQYYSRARILTGSNHKMCNARLSSNKVFREVYIAEMRVGYSFTSGEKATVGRGFLDVFIDEAKQIAIKEFKGKDFTISIVPVNEKLAQYYEKAGFKRGIDGKVGMMKMKINSVTLGK